MPAEPEKVPIPGNKTGVNQPDSPYGDVAELERLKGELGPPRATPTALPPAAGNPAPPQAGVPLAPPGSPRGPAETSPVEGIPAPMFDPTQRPDIPASTPPANPDAGRVQTATDQQRRLQVLYALSESSNPVVREWAEIQLELLVGGS